MCIWNFVFVFENKPAKYCNCAQWLTDAMHMLLRTLPPAPCPYQGMDFQLLNWKEIVNGP